MSEIFLRTLVVSFAVMFAAAVLAEFFVPAGIIAAFLGGVFCTDRGWLRRSS